VRYGRDKGVRSGWGNGEEWGMGIGMRMRVSEGRRE